MDVNMAFADSFTPNCQYRVLRWGYVANNKGKKHVCAEELCPHCGNVRYLFPRAGTDIEREILRREDLLDPDFTSICQVIMSK